MFSPSCNRISFLSLSLSVRAMIFNSYTKKKEKNEQSVVVYMNIIIWLIVAILTIKLSNRARLRGEIDVRSLARDHFTAGKRR